MISTLLLLFIFVACHADVAVTPPAQPQVLCGELPSKIFSCIGNPSVHSTEAARKCKGASNSCDRMTCIFRESGWLGGATVNKAKMIEHFEQYSAEHPEWTLAVQHTKAACLTLDLPAQGYHLNCPAYDIMMCSLASFIKNAQPSQWSASQQCEHSRRFAASCPVCPAECFVSAIPIGSCNACYALPRSP